MKKRDFLKAGAIAAVAAPVLANAGGGSERLYGTPGSVDPAKSRDSTLRLSIARSELPVETWDSVENYANAVRAVLEDPKARAAFATRGFAATSQWEPGQEEYEFVKVEGDGVHEIPVGPVHAGIIEPGHFRFQVVGEKVLRLEERLCYTHKGIEKRFTELAPLDGAALDPAGLSDLVAKLPPGGALHLPGQPPHLLHLGRPLPNAVVPGLVALINGEHASGRVRVSEVVS